MAVAVMGSSAQSDIRVRPFRAGDAEPLANVMHASIQQGTTEHYSQNERAAWSPQPHGGTRWQQRLESVATFVAEDSAGIAGFITLADDGYIDLAFVRPDCMRAGVGLALYTALEASARAAKMMRLYCQASDVAEPFFRRQGWRRLVTQQVEANGVALQNHQMEKLLG